MSDTYRTLYGALLDDGVVSYGKRRVVYFDGRCQLWLSKGARSPWIPYGTARHPHAAVQWLIAGETDSIQSPLLTWAQEINNE